jgi:hypothetical protein
MRFSIRENDLTLLSLTGGNSDGTLHGPTVCP